MSKLTAAIVSCLQNLISPFLINKKLFTDTDSERALVIAFDHRFQNCLFTFSAFSLCDIFAYSCLKLKPIHKLFERNAFFKTSWLLNAVFDFRLFDYVRLFECLISECSIVLDWQIFGWVRLCSIAEPNRSQSNDWSSIGFDYRTFDWLRRDRLNFIMILLFGRSEWITRDNDVTIVLALNRIVALIGIFFRNAWRYLHFFGCL